MGVRVFGFESDSSFLEHGLFGRIGLGEIQALKARQYGGSSRAGASLLSAFDVLEAIISMRPRRELMVLPMDVPRVVAASDAALEAPRQGSGGYHLVFQDGGVQIREAFVAIPSQVYDMWGPGDHKIAQLELFMVVHALTARPDQFRGVVHRQHRQSYVFDQGAGVTTPTWPRWRRIFSVCSLRCEPPFTGNTFHPNPIGPTRSAD